METNEIMNNEAVMEEAERIVAEGSNKGLKIGAGIGVGVLVGGIIYKYLVKPIIAKKRAEKESEATVDAENVKVIDGEDVEESK